MRRAAFLLSLLLFGIISGPASAKPGDMRKAYEDGWNWYLHRKAQGADEGELLSVLQTLKRKYGHTYFNMGRVDRALAELHGGADGDEDPADLTVEPFAPSVASSPTPIAPPAHESSDPFERDMARQRSLLKTGDPNPAASAGKVESAKTVVAVRPAVPAAALSNPAAQAKIDELSSEDEMTQVKAAQALGEMREPGAVGPLIQLLGGGSTFASMAASSALAKIGKPAVQPLVGALQNANANVRLGACVALGDIRDPAVEPALQKAALDQDSRVRKSAATALSKLKS